MQVVGRLQLVGQCQVGVRTWLVSVSTRAGVGVRDGGNRSESVRMNAPVETPLYSLNQPATECPSILPILPRDTGHHGQTVTDRG